MIEDKSVSGLGIQLAKSIPVGTPITVKFCNRTVPCVVRRCIKADVGVFIGVQFELDAREVPDASLNYSARPSLTQ